MTELATRPQPIDIGADTTAVIVVDMQNAFASAGGMFDLAGFDISGAAPGHRGQQAPACGRSEGRRHRGLSADVIPTRPWRRR